MTNTPIHSSIVIQHVQYLRRTIDAHALFRGELQSVSGGMVSTSAELRSSAINDVDLNLVREQVDLDHESGVPILASTKSFIDRLTHCVEVGGRIAQQLEHLESDFKRAEGDVVRTKQDYDHVALLDSVPVLDGAERLARHSVDDKYQTYQAALRARSDTHDLQVEMATQWLHTMQQQLV